MITGFRTNDEINLWCQWATTFATRLTAKESEAEADYLLAAWRERMVTINLMPKPGRA